MKHFFYPEALLEYSDAVLYYESCRLGLGAEFIADIEFAISRIEAAPSRWRVFDGEFRRLLVKKFPYAVVYTVEIEYVMIHAIMHCSRAPGFWKARGDR